MYAVRSDRLLVQEVVSWILPTNQFLIGLETVAAALNVVVQCICIVVSLGIWIDVVIITRRL